VTSGFRVAKVDLVVDLVPSGRRDAMVSVYAVDGRSSSLVVQVPSGPFCPATVSPVAPTSVTASNEPEDALTVTVTLGATSVARSAGKTSSTVGMVSVVGVGAADVHSGPWVPEPPEAAAEVPWQALSKTLTAISAATRPLPDHAPVAFAAPVDGAVTSYRSQVMAAGRCSAEPPGGVPVLLHYFADLSVAQIASQLNKADGTMKRDLYDARARLAQMTAQLEGTR
jgi:hypothetical protein